jgi:hypothetical protein
MVYKATISKNIFSTTLVSKIFFDTNFSGENFFLVNFQKLVWAIVLLFILYTNHRTLKLTHNCFVKSPNFIKKVTLFYVLLFKIVFLLLILQMFILQKTILVFSITNILKIWIYQIYICNISNEFNHVFCRYL